jgi:hypothetical protein
MWRPYRKQVSIRETPEFHQAMLTLRAEAPVRKMFFKGKNKGKTSKRRYNAVCRDHMFVVCQLTRSLIWQRKQKEQWHLQRQARRSTTNRATKNNETA